MITYSIIQKSQIETAHRIDAEYFQPIFLDIEKKVFSSKSYMLWGDIEGHFITGPFGSEFIVDDYTTDSHYRYIRGKDVKEFFLYEEDNVYIPESDFMRLKKYSLKEGDILVSVVGTLGNVSIVDSSMLPAIFSCKSTAFRTQSINAYYLLAYLNSKYGHSLLERNMRGAVQTGLNIEDLRSLPIFIPKKEQQNAIPSIIINAKKIFNESKVLYTQAEDLLLNELGLKDFKIEDDLTCTVNLSDLKSAHRADADYFQPKYERVLSQIRTYNTHMLGDLVSMKKGVEPGSDAYEDEGKLFIRVSSITKHGIIDKDQKYLSDELYQTLRKSYESKIGDILLTKDATPGIAYVLKEQIEGIIAGGVIRLKIKEDIEAEYLALCINSVIGQMQIERDAGGSVIVHWKPEQIKKLQIPVLPKSTQKKIADLVRQSHEAREKAKELLEKAKKEVEKLIEGTE
jgi:restriction endonuclease S subunit